MAGSSAAKERNLGSLLSARGILGRIRLAAKGGYSAGVWAQAPGAGTYRGWEKRSPQRSSDGASPNMSVRQPRKEGTKKEKQKQLKVEIRHHLWKRFWKSFLFLKQIFL